MGQHGSIRFDSVRSYSSKTKEPIVDSQITDYSQAFEVEVFLTYPCESRRTLV